MTKAQAIERCRELFGIDVACTIHRIPSDTPGRYYETVRSIHRPSTQKRLATSLHSWEMAIAAAEKMVARGL